MKIRVDWWSITGLKNSMETKKTFSNKTHHSQIIYGKDRVSYLTNSLARPLILFCTLKFQISLIFKWRRSINGWSIIPEF